VSDRVETGQTVTAEQLRQEVGQRNAAEKIRAAATLLAEAGTVLGKLGEPKQRWYDCNKLYHGAINWLDRWEAGDA
jgi:hypothetical protein